MTEYRKLPRGTEMIGTLGLGMGGIQSAPPEEIEAVVSQAIENGINFFDLCAGGASVYEPFGRAIRGKREKVYFQLHFGAVYNAAGEYGWSRDLSEIRRTFAWGAPMPALARLPFMMAELAVFAAVSGLFSDKIARNGWMAFPAVLLAAVSGRAFFLLLAVLFQSVAPFTPALVWSQIAEGLLALVLQAVLVPFLVMGLRALLLRDKK